MEEWRDIEGYEGCYQVSNMGRVKSLDRIGGNNHVYKGKILKQRLKTSGYLQVQLCKNSNHYFYAIHRLVAKAFIPNPDNKPTVNHLDEDKTNNKVSNLEWATHKENTNYGRCIEKRVNSRDYQAIKQKKIETFKKHGYCRKVKQFDLKGNLVAEYESINDASRATGFSHSGIIHSCKQYNRCRNYKGYKWEYA